MLPVTDEFKESFGQSFYEPSNIDDLSVTGVVRLCNLEDQTLNHSS